MGKPSGTSRSRPPPSPATSAQLLDLSAAPARAWNRRQLLSLAVLVAVGLASSISRIWDFDIFWHLACGEWMFRNHQVMGFDYFCLDADKNGWINVHWFFQVLVTAIFKLGGWSCAEHLQGRRRRRHPRGYALSLRRHVPQAWLIACGLLMLIVMQSRSPGRRFSRSAC